MKARPETNSRMRQDFDIGDLVAVALPVLNNFKTDGMGVVTETKLINESTADLLEKKRWHIDEYHCRIKLSDGESRWIRAKFLKIVAKAKFNS